VRTELPSATAGCGSRRIWCVWHGLLIPAQRRAPPWLLRWGALTTARPDGLPASDTIDVTTPSDRNALKRAVRTRSNIPLPGPMTPRLVIANAVDVRSGAHVDPYRSALACAPTRFDIAARGDRSWPPAVDHGRSLANTSGAWPPRSQKHVLAHAAGVATCVKMKPDHRQAPS